jgi:hypothetical protein
VLLTITQAEHIHAHHVLGIQEHNIQSSEISTRKRRIYPMIALYSYNVHPCPFPKLVGNSATIFSFAVAYGGRLNDKTCECTRRTALAEGTWVDDQDGFYDLYTY